MRDSISWSDRFVNWLKILPSPFWFSCSLVGLVIFLIDICLYFLADLYINPNSGVSQGTIVSVFGLLGFVPAYILYIIGLIPLQISVCVQKFRPVLKLSDPESEPINNQILLRNIPNRWLWAGQRFALLLSIVTLISLWFSLAGTHLTNILFTIFFALSLLLLIFLSAIVFLRIGNVLRQVFRLQYKALDINILHPIPLFAISRLTQKLALYVLPIATALGFLAISLGLSTWKYYVSTGDQPSLGEMIILLPLFLLGPSLLLLSIFIFTFPVLWIRRLILEKKEEALDQLATRLQSIFSEYSHRVTNGEWANVGDLTSSVTFLNAQEERYRKIPEWPWEGRILREFIGALVIPVLLWVMQFYLEKFINALPK